MDPAKVLLGTPGIGSSERQKDMGKFWLKVKIWHLLSTNGIFYCSHSSQLWFVCVSKWSTNRSKTVDCILMMIQMSLKMEAIHSLETGGVHIQTTWCYIPEDSTSDHFKHHVHSVLETDVLVITHTCAHFVLNSFDRSNNNIYYMAIGSSISRFTVASGSRQFESGDPSSKRSCFIIIWSKGSTCSKKI
jgi:hypothetical protein